MCAFVLLSSLPAALAAEKDETPKKEKEEPGEAKAPPPDYFQKLYAGYTPDFLRFCTGRGSESIVGWAWGGAQDKLSELSTEKTFNSFNLLEEDQRVYALIKAARRFEGQGESRDALKIYQQAIEQFPNALFRVDEHGIFVPAVRYCQYRLLALPKADLEFYRTLYDPRAKEAFEAARRQYSAIGFQEIVDGMLATSYGDDALLALGDAALDTGYFEEALEHFTLIRKLFQGADTDTPELALKIAYCRRKLGNQAAEEKPGQAQSALPAGAAARFRQVVAKTTAQPEDPAARLASPPHLASSDYYAFAPSGDPVAVAEPEWRRALHARREHDVYTQPLATEDSLIYKHKNVVHCRSLLNGHERWRCELGGRVTIQQEGEQAHRQEEVLVQDNLVFTNLYKRGFSLAALDLNTGQLRWAAGPMAPATKQDTQTRYEAAPAAGPRVLYAPYIFDNIEGDTHFDTAYGVKALEAESGRVLWDQPLCRLAPGKISTNIAVRRRNLIRSFAAPPALHQGTVYHNTHAGAIAALDARSGRIKWIMRYPYWPSIHDATIGFRTMFPWFPQRPLVAGPYLIVAPVDSPMLLCLERATGKVVWAKMKGKDYKGHAGHKYLGEAWVLGPTQQGLLALVYSGRWGPIELLEPDSGKVVWESPDVVKPESSPALTFEIPDGIMLGDPGKVDFRLAARPTLSSDDRLYLAHAAHIEAGQNKSFRGYAYNLSCVALGERRVVQQRMHFDPTVKAAADWLIGTQAPALLAEKRTDEEAKRFEAVASDQPPRDEHGPFMPLTRMGFERFGNAFEVRCGPREISVVFDRPAVERVLAAREDAQAKFLRAELALAENRLAESAKLLHECLATISSNEVDFRARVHRLLYRVGVGLAQEAIRRRQPQQERACALGLAESASSIDEEIQSLLAIADAAVRLKEPEKAAAGLQALIRHYGSRPYAVCSLAAEDLQSETMAAVFQALGGHVGEKHYTAELRRPLQLASQHTAVYTAAVSPLARPVRMEVSTLAAARLLELRRQFAAWAPEFDEKAKAVLSGASPDAALRLLQEFPGTPAAQSALERLAGEAKTRHDAERRGRLWSLAETARRCGLRMPQELAAELAFVSEKPAGKSLPANMTGKDLAIENEDVLRLLLPRRDAGTLKPELAFLGGRARKRLDNKFELLCIDLRSNRLKWSAANPEGRNELRLRGTGQEPGFEEVFVTHGLAIVHGLFNVVAFDLETGKERWHYRAPFDFEIEHVMQAGDLMILAGSAQTLALFIPTHSPAGKVVWEAPEEGEPYAAPWVRGERLLSVRHSPDGVTARHLGTGRLIARLELPGLSRFQEHPLGSAYPEDLPIAHHGDRLLVSDGWYYICVDTAKMEIAWKRLIDQNDPTREPPLRFALGAQHLVVLKHDFENTALHGIDAQSGALLWHSDPKKKDAPLPLHDFRVEGAKVLGLSPGQRGFRAVQLDAASGKTEWSWESSAYKETASSALVDAYASGLVVRVAEGQRFNLVALQPGQKDPLHVLEREGVGPFGVHGRASALVQDGRLLLWTKNVLATAGE